MLPLVSSDNRAALQQLIDEGLADETFMMNGFGQMVTTEMAEDQNIDRFMQLGKELQGRLNKIERQLNADH